MEKILIQNHQTIVVHQINGGIPFSWRKSKPEIIVFHHTATASWERTLRTFQRGGASSHYEIEKDGTIYQYLDPATQYAWHCVGRNPESIGIDLTHVTGRPFTIEQMAAAASLLRFLAAQFSINLSYDGKTYFKNASPKKIDLPLASATVYGHGQLSPTQCPDGLDVGAIVRMACSQTFCAPSTLDP
jgi:hypothetical protein